jgi:DNA-binding XRE family transcriptional regulator
MGRHQIVNQFGRVSVCPHCGEWTIESGELGRLELQAAIVAFLEAPIDRLAGAELRDARKALCLTQAQFAAALGMSVSTVSHWENDHESLPDWLKPALVGLAKTQLDPEPAGPTLRPSVE